MELHNLWLSYETNIHILLDTAKREICLENAYLKLYKKPNALCNSEGNIPIKIKVNA